MVVIFWLNDITRLLQYYYNLSVLNMKERTIHYKITGESKAEFRH